MSRVRINANNLTATYKFIDKNGNPPGTLWNKEILEEAHVLHKKVTKFNELQELRAEWDVAKVKVATQKNRSDLSDAESVINKRIAILDESLADFGSMGTYQVPDIHGERQSRTIPMVPDDHYLRLAVNGIVQVSNFFGDDDNGKTDVLKNGSLYELEASRVARHKEKEQKECEHATPPWKFWKECWTSGTWNHDGYVWSKNIDKMVGNLPTYEWRDMRTLSDDTRTKKQHQTTVWKMLSEKIGALVQNHADQLKDVDQVICFGLGAIDYITPRCFIQHMAAHTVAKALEHLKEARGTPMKVKVLSQDPAYCQNCTSILEDELDITTTTNLDGYLRVTRNTFVITFCPSNPVLGIVADLMKESGGPAAILCDKIDDDYMKPEYETGWTSANQPTRNVVDFKRRCTEEYFGDSLEFMKTSFATFRKKFRTVPAQMPRVTKEQINARLVSVEEYAKSAQCCFRDAYLYVPKH